MVKIGKLEKIGKFWKFLENFSLWKFLEIEKFFEKKRIFEMEIWIIILCLIGFVIIFSIASRDK